MFLTGCPSQQHYRGELCLKLRNCSSSHHLSVLPQSLSISIRLQIFCKSKYYTKAAVHLHPITLERPPPTQKTTIGIPPKKPAQSGVRRVSAVSRHQWQLFRLVANTFYIFQIILDLMLEKFSFFKFQIYFPLPPRPGSNGRSCATDTFSITRLRSGFQKKGGVKENIKDRHCPLHTPPHINHQFSHPTFKCIPKVYIPGNVLVFQSWTTPSDSLTVIKTECWISVFMPGTE